MNASLNDIDFVLGLEENVMNSLIHGVEHFIDGEKPTDLKYSIPHIFHAHFTVKTCERCGSYIFSSGSSADSEDELGLCEYCWDDINQRIAED